jgi:AraC-like DNA-binding protein
MDSGTNEAMVPGSCAAGFQKSPVLARLCVGPARGLYIGPGLDMAPHMNAAIRIAVGLEQPFFLQTWTPKGGLSDWEPCEARAIPSETVHHLRSSGPMACLYLDPLQDHRSPLSEQDLLRGRDHLRAVGADRVGIHEAFAAFGVAARTARDARIARVVLEVERRPFDFGRIQEAAALACLSPSRFRSRFHAEIGLPFRRYRLWRRMAVVMRTIAAGGNLTEAAHAAGFSSSAHLSSAFRRMFGLSVSELLSRDVRIDLSEDDVVAGGVSAMMPGHAVSPGDPTGPCR